MSGDLIFALRGEPRERYLNDIRQLGALGVSHVSAYALSLSVNSPLRRLGVSPAAEDDVAESLSAGRELLGELGFDQYEVSNFARPGFESRHNSLVWGGASYLGLGAAAHSFLAEPRFVRVANPPFSRYLAADPIDEFPLRLSGARLEHLTTVQIGQDLLMQGLRTRNGVDLGQYERWTGRNLLEEQSDAIQVLVQRGWIEVLADADAIRPTSEGIWFADELALTFA